MAQGENILITITRYDGGVKIRGHANYAEPGKDIVCAAVSTLAQTLIQSFLQLAEDTITYDIQPGAVDMKFRYLSERGKVLIDAFFIGCRMIADEYPDNVRVV